MAELTEPEGFDVDLAKFEQARQRRKLGRRVALLRREALRRCLAHAGVEARQREGLVLAIHGALWYRLLLDEPLMPASSVG